MTYIIQVKVSEQTLMDLLCTAVEGGSNYWARFTDAVRTPTLDYLSVELIEHEASSGTELKRAHVGLPELALGLERLAEAGAAWEAGDRQKGFASAFKHFTDALSDHDATTADVVLQMAVFGEVVYG